MPGSYSDRLAAGRLRACYDAAPPRTRAYLEAEIGFVLARARASARALELGCGCGRVLQRLRPRVRVLFSGYAARFWPDRLEWFEAQAARGLIGPIDYAATGDGVIVCADGFRATTVGPEEFAELAAALGIEPRIVEVDGSSLFCELVTP